MKSVDLQSQRLEEVIGGLAGKRVLVIGDLMLDEYLGGEVKRISPEAPVPIVEITHRAHVPGGAGNVAANIARLGGRPVLLGIVGRDENGRTLCESLEQLGVDVSAVQQERGRTTTCKTRIVSGQQQIVRLDREVRVPTEDSMAGKLMDLCGELLPAVEACVLSDYAKGLLTGELCSRLIARIRAAGKPVVVDPKDQSFGKYAGCSVITPNQREAELAAGANGNETTSMDALARSLQRILGDRTAILITRGAEGMSLFECERPRLDVPALAHEVFDVTGAGDTVAGTLALAMATGAALADAMVVANLAASVVVQKSGTATLTTEELRDAKHAATERTPQSGLSGNGSGNRSYASLPNRRELR